MKSPTIPYRKLIKDLRGIQGLLNNVPATENKTNLHHLKVQAYIFMAHAAFEEYLEALASLVLTESVSNFNTKQQINACIVSLITFETIAQLDKNIPRKEIRAEIVKKLRDFVNIAKKNHDGVISTNNGVRVKNQKALLLPIGLDPEDVDSVTASSLDAFGTKRGGVAHSVKIKTEETKSSALSETKTLLAGLMAFDREARRIIQVKMIARENQSDVQT